MFSGIIREIGSLVSVNRKGSVATLEISGGEVVRTLGIGSSVSVDGVCLTVVSVQGRKFKVEVSKTTAVETTLSSLMTGARLNLEPSLRVGDEIGGHLLTGHIDEIGRIISFEKRGEDRRLVISLSKDGRRYVVPKGSIALDGISFTVQDVEPKGISIMVIPFTYENTNLKYKRAGSPVNVEFDQFVKTLAHLLSSHGSRS